ncbi:MAG: DUF4383 domain-containing protein [Microbacteriaceae bacterium]|nr:DUF4383 domain-containing protein [Microbacteriaceae bacterium]
MTKSPNRLLATVFGTVYLVFGLLGFAFTGGFSFFSTTGGLLLGMLEVNIFHNVVHLMIGAALLIAGLTTIPAARAVNLSVGALLFALGVAGIFLTNTSANVLAINGADNVLHFACAVVLLAVAVGAEKRVAPPRSGATV